MLYFLVLNAIDKKEKSIKLILVELSLGMKPISNKLD